MAKVGGGTAIGVTNVAPFIPEIWSTKYIEAYVANAVISDKVDRRFDAEMKFGDTLHVGQIATVTPTSKTTNTQVTFTATTESWVNVSVDKHYYIAREIETIASDEINVDVMNKYVSHDAAEMARYIDADVATIFTELNSNTTVGTLLLDVTDDNLLRCVQYLDDSNVPKEDRNWFWSPATWTSVMKLDKFVRLDYVNPSGATAVERAKLNYPVYGSNVYVTTNVEGDNTNGHNCGLVQKEAIILIMQAAPRVHKQFVIQNLTDAIVTEAVWGKGEARNLNGVCLKGR